MTKTAISATVYLDGWLGGCIRQVNPHHHHEQDALSEQHGIIQIKDIEEGASRKKKEKRKKNTTVRTCWFITRLTTNGQPKLALHALSSDDGQAKLSKTLIDHTRLLKAKSCAVKP